MYVECPNQVCASHFNGSVGRHHPRSVWVSEDHRYFSWAIHSEEDFTFYWILVSVWHCYTTCFLYLMYSRSFSALPVFFHAPMMTGSECGHSGGGGGGGWLQAGLLPKMCFPASLAVAQPWLLPSAPPTAAETPSRHVLPSLDLR